MPTYFDLDPATPATSKDAKLILIRRLLAELMESRAQALDEDEEERCWRKRWEEAYPHLSSEATAAA